MAEHFKRFDWLLFACILIITAMGLVLIFNIGKFQPKIEKVFEKQLIISAVGFFLILAVSFFDYRIFRNWSTAALAFYLFSIAFLVAVLFLGTVTRGSKSWFVSGNWGFQPVELAKLALIIILAKYFSKSHIEIHRWQHIFISGVYFGLVFLLVLAQPDLGSAATVFMIWLGMMLVAGIGWRKLLILMLIGIIAVGLSWVYALKPYQKSRVMSFINPSLDPLGASYNSKQALIAIGSGGMFGRGLANSTQSQYGFLPQAYNDFIVAAVGETWGFAGMLFLFALWLLIFWRIGRIAVNSQNNFARLFCAGFMILLASHFLINAGVNLGLLPITGLPSPFLSAGGSHFLVLAIGMALIQNMKINNSL